MIGQLDKISHCEADYNIYLEHFELEILIMKEDVIPSGNRIISFLKYQ